MTREEVEEHVNHIAPFSLEQIHVFKMSMAKKYTANNAWNYSSRMKSVPLVCCVIAGLSITSMLGFGPYQEIDFHSKLQAIVICLGGAFCLLVIQWIFDSYAEGPVRWSVYAGGDLSSCMPAAFTEWTRKNCPGAWYEIELLKRVNETDSENSLASILWIYLPCEEGFDTVKRGLWAAEAGQLSPENKQSRRDSNSIYTE